jgi:hypothetical protein
MSTLAPEGKVQAVHNSMERDTGLQVQLTERPLLQQLKDPLMYEGEAYEGAQVPLFPGEARYERALAEAKRHPELWGEELEYWSDEQLASFDQHLVASAAQAAEEDQPDGEAVPEALLAECPRLPLLVHYDGVAKGPLRWDVMRLLLPSHSDYERVFCQRASCGEENPQLAMPYASAAFTARVFGAAVERLESTEPGTMKVQPLGPATPIGGV